MTTSLLLSLVLPFQPDEQIKDLATRKVVQAMMDVYSSCKTYQDTGSVTSGDYLVTFKTYYSRPNKFYHEFTGKNYYSGRHVLWCRGSLKSNDPKDIKENRREGNYLETLYWDDKGPEIEVMDLGSAVSSCAGISMRASSTVAQYLFPREASAFSCAEITDLKLEKPQTIRGILCDVLYSKEVNERFWITKKTHLLIQRDDYDGEKLSRTKFSPSIGGKIPDSQFLFRPPSRR